MRRISCILAFLMGCAPLFAGDAWLGFSFKDRGGKGVDPCTLIVAGVHPQSGAAKAGIKADDRVVQIDGKPIANLAALKKRMQSAKVGSILPIGYLRNGKLQSVQVNLTARPDDIRNLMGSHVGSKAYPLAKHFYGNESAVQKAPKAILLDFWATWCGPCRASIPMLREVYSRRKNQGFEVIGISSEQLSVLKDFQQMEKEPWPLYQDVGSQQSAKWGVSAVPTMILLDKDWIVQRVWQGPPSPDELDRAIVNLLGKQ